MVCWAKIPTRDLYQYIRNSLTPECALRAALDPYYKTTRQEMVGKAYKELARRRKRVPDILEARVGSH